MNLDELKTLTIGQSKGWVTNADPHKISEDFFERVRGLRNTTDGYLAERDYGCKHRYAAADYPTLNNGAVTLLANGTIEDAVDGTQFDVVAGLDTAGKLHVWAWTGTAFVELTRVISATLDSAISVGAGSEVVLTGLTENGLSIPFPADNELEGYVFIDTQGGMNKAALISGNTFSTSSAMLTGVNIGPTGMNLAFGDSVKLYKTAGIFTGEFQPSKGLSPLINWLPEDTQRKITLFYATGASPIVSELPLIIMRRPQRKYFYAGASPGTPELALPAVSATGWFAEQGGGLFPYCAIFGGRKGFHYNTNAWFDSSAATAPDSTNYPANSWLSIAMKNDTSYPVSAANNHWAIVYVTLGYDNYEESDPIFKFFFGCFYNSGTLSDTNFYFQAQIKINPATMPKNVTELRFYVYDVTLPGTLDNQALYDFLGAVGDDQILLFQTIKLQEFTSTPDTLAISTDSLDSQGRFIVIDYHTGTPTAGQGLRNPETSDSITSNLGHAVLDARELIKPRYGTRGTKEQGAVVVVDKDDATLRLSSYDGSGTNEDDNFPDVSTDNNGDALSIYLASFGELLGIGVNNDQIVALKTNQIEIADLQAGQRQQVIQADVLARRSIIQTPYGLVWAGNSGIYILPWDGGGIRVLNKPWQNFWDGTLPAGNGTQFLSRTQRQAAFAVYDPTYKTYCIAFTCATEDGLSTEQLIARYYFELGKWDVRQLGGFSATWFSQRVDTLAIGEGSGILFYPNNQGAGQHKDGVASDDSGGVGIPYKWKLVLGSLYDLTTENVFAGVKFDHIALGTGSYVYRLYINNLTTPIERESPISLGPVMRPIPAVGSLRDLSLECELVDDVSTITKLDISTIQFAYIPRVNAGVR